jgi:hypothetical protein
MRQLLERIENEYLYKWDNYADANAWVKGKIKKHGRLYVNTQDYRDNVLPVLLTLHKQAKDKFIDNQKKKADELGFVAGKRVESQYGSMLAGMQTITGTTVMYKGKPMVKLDHKIDVAANGKIREGRYVNYSAGWKEIEK